jgi:hypothetical protein
VVGDVAAAAGLVDFDAFAAERLAREQDVLFFGAAAERDHRRLVLEQEQRVGDAAFGALLEQLFLQRERIAVSDTPQALHGERPLHC